MSDAVEVATNERRPITFRGCRHAVSPFFPCRDRVPPPAGAERQLGRRPRGTGRRSHCGARVVSSQSTREASKPLAQRHRRADSCTGARPHRIGAKALCDVEGLVQRCGTSHDLDSAWRCIQVGDDSVRGTQVIVWLNSAAAMKAERRLLDAIDLLIDGDRARSLRPARSRASDRPLWSGCSGSSSTGRGGHRRRCQVRHQGRGGAGAYSRWRPRIRSAMMLRRMVTVPPMIV